MSIRDRNQQYVTPSNPEGNHTGCDGNTYNKNGDFVSYGKYNAYDDGYQQGRNDGRNENNNNS